MVVCKGKPVVRREGLRSHLEDDNSCDVMCLVLSTANLKGVNLDEDHINVWLETPASLAVGIKQILRNWYCVC